ncbi:iron complex transport system ATP-binding protein [Paenibacillus sp. 1_12]|uniref:ABC transporter ATP-binding protein n=1 Tax=Paenibacillus sp. 1_12 TaxID=1566278 RepID=UPI0008EA4D4D|nr:ABC transporter ATP-binding protein [Paenibacillus sp. 1_12]SFM16944.1 iron complex transport system ATP-binding protein [Paenibacillus sp. 1_12]
MIEVVNTSFYYEQTHVLFKDLSLTVKEGETLAVLGVNGAGKTTFIKCLMGFQKFKTGYMCIDGTQAQTLSLTDFWKRISYVPQAKHTSFGYSVTEMVVMGLSPYIAMGNTPTKGDYLKARDMIDQMGLAGIAKRPCNQISGGQLQMVLIARALVKKPKVLIMDEPESNFDMKNQLMVLEIIKWLNKQKLTIIINTHFPAHALRVAEQTLIIGQNEHVIGQTEHIISEHNLEKYFGVQSEMISSSKSGRTVSGILPTELVHPMKLDSIS